MQVVSTWWDLNQIPEPVQNTSTDLNSSLTLDFKLPKQSVLKARGYIVVSWDLRMINKIEKRWLQSGKSVECNRDKTIQQ